MLEACKISELTRSCEHHFSVYQHGLSPVICNLPDFAENYSFVLQDEAEGFHWNNAQATIRLFVIYSKKSVA
jgi:hypothetical protein